jgi:hypothetical protein
MKMKKTLILSTIVLWTLATGTYAMYGQGKWHCKGMWQWMWKIISSEERSKLQSMSIEDRQKYMQELREKHWEKGWHGMWKRGNNWERWEKWHNPSEMLNSVEKQDLSSIEKDLLLKQYEEEMMANELYTSFYEKYWIETFKNIANSESKHMQAVKALLDRYGLETPTNYNHIKDLYEQLKEEWSKSAFDALEVWVKIEFVDIDDIITAIKSTDNNDIKIVFTNIGWWSYNHLRWFLKAIDNNWYETKLDWKKYISEDDLNVKWPIKYKLAETLEKEWVKLPEQVSSENMKKKCKWHRDNNWESREHWKRDFWKERWFNPNIKKYQDFIENKYKSKLDSFSQDKIKTTIEKIDTLLEKIRTDDKYTNRKKRLYHDVLEALKMSLNDRLEQTNTTSILNWVLWQ